MSGLSCICRCKVLALAPNSSSSPGQEPKKAPKTDSGTLPIRKKQPLQEQKLPRPAVIRLERAIGAGSFRDTEPRDSDQQRSIFDGILGERFEGKVEKRIRETGEWLTDTTETKVRSSGKEILFFFMKLLLPIWIFSLLVATQVIDLPWNSPFLDDLFM